MRHRLPAGAVRVAMLAFLIVAAGAAGAADKPAAGVAASAPARASAAPARVSPRHPAAASTRGTPAVKGTAAAPAAAPLLTPEQARECLDSRQDDGIRAQRDQAIKDKASVASERDAIATLGTALADGLAVLDRTDEAQVAAYNAKVAERDKQIDAYQAKVTAFNAKADAVNAAAQARSAACANRRYDERQLTPPKRKK